MPVRPEYVLAATQDSPFYGTRKTMAQLLSRMDEGVFQTEPLPPGWLVRRWGGWEGWTPRDWRPRVQGWKIHVSTIPEDATETLARVTRLCVERGVAFKFLPLLSNLVDSNGKQQDRGASGKFITIYPDDDDQFAELLEALEGTLHGQRGPYILSDLRYRDAPVYARYGGIMMLSYPDAQDRPVSAIASVEGTTLIPDERQPRFHRPEGVELPECLHESWARATSSAPSRLREFKAVSPLHFSNAGGVYKATLPDGTQHTLREARSHTGLDARGRDAVTRQREEEGILRDLVGLPGVQQLVGTFWSWEHRYLELEYAEGRPLTAWVVQNTPFHGDPDSVAAYAQRCTSVGAQIVTIVESIHGRGWSLGDLHPGNILVSDDDRVTVIDFEDASRVGEPRQIGFRVFEYCAPEQLDAVEADWYAIARSLMLMYVPDWEIEVVAPDFWQDALARVHRVFGEQAADQIRAVEKRCPRVERHMLAPRDVVGTLSDVRDAEAVMEALIAGVEWSRRFSPTGSYPGDPTHAGDVTESFGYGRAGVVWARGLLGREIAASDLDALVEAATGEVTDPGLYTGWAGVAMALSEARRHEAAVEAAHAALTESLGRRRLDLFGGRAGVVLAAIEVARGAGDPGLLAEALGANERLQRSVREGAAQWEALTHRRGLHFGLTGLALLDLVAHVATGEDRLLDRAVDRIRSDLESCIVTASGDLMVRDVDANRALPYVEWGSAGVWGVALAAERLTGRRLLTEAELAAAMRACSSDLYVYSSLDHGRAGIMAVLACAGASGAPEALRQRDLLLPTLLERDGMAFCVGDGLVRLSADLSTGAAGVAVALHAVAGTNPFAWLPVSSATSGVISLRTEPAGPAWPAPREVDPRAALEQPVTV